MRPRARTDCSSDGLAGPREGRRGGQLREHGRARPRGSQQPHLAREACALVLAPAEGAQAEGEAAHGRDRQARRRQPEAEQAARGEPQPAVKGPAPDEREHDHVRGGGERPEAGVQDRAGEEELKGVGGNPREVQQERHRHVEAAEEAEDPRRGEARVVRGGRTVSENHAANSTKLSDSILAAWGKL